MRKHNCLPRWSREEEWAWGGQPVVEDIVCGEHDGVCTPVGDEGRPNSVPSPPAGARRADEGHSLVGNQASGALGWHALTRLASLATLSGKRWRGDFSLAAAETVAPESTESHFFAVTEQ